MKNCIYSENIDLINFCYMNISQRNDINIFLSESTQNIKIFNYFIKRGAYITDKVFTTHCFKITPNNKLENSLKMIDYLIDCYPEHCRIENVLNFLSHNSPIYNYLMDFLYKPKFY